MDATALAALFVASTINAALPGPCTITTFGRTARSGWRAGAAVTLGVLAANTILVAAALLVMLGALTLSAAALGVMKWAGIVALVALAALSLRVGSAADRQAGPIAARDGTAGLMVGLSSPYNLVFYLALLPQVLPAPGLAAGSVAMLWGVILAGVLMAQGAATALAMGCRGTLGRRGRWVDGVCAACLLGIALTAALVPADRAGLTTGPTLVSGR